MSAKKKPTNRPTPKFERAKRPIVWIGGSGIPGGATGKKLIALGHPLHWEPGSSKAARSVATLQPVIVVLESERMSESLLALLFTLTELKSTIDMVVFQLRRREPRQIADGVDGILMYGPSLVQQIKTILATMAGSRAFKATGLRAQKRLKKVRGELDRLRTLAVKDDLTCIYNLRFFNRSLENEHQRALRFGRSYSLIFLDLDGLREVNSRKGHLVGGQVLKQVATFVSDRVRRIDLPARIGGDEFVIICPETAKPAARLVAERIRSGIERLQDDKGKSLEITASIGVASFPDDGNLPEEVLQRADRALYEAKSRGKNRVCSWGDFEADGDDKSFLGSVHHTADNSPSIEKLKTPDGSETIN